ncbi:MAG: DUF5343 domain-containing protein [Chloroflexota bacterium]|nr:DUF5343 domain-containing protein [Chloroflexota bacterium]
MANGTPALSTNRPYAPSSNVIAVLQRLRSRKLPERIDGEYLRSAGVSEGTVGRTLFALSFLHLIEESGAPTAALRQIATSTDEEYQAILAGIIRDVYRDVFEVLDPREDSQDRILNFFRRYTPASQRQRMVIFFLGLCREAGIATMDVPRNRPSSAGSSSKGNGAKGTSAKVSAAKSSKPIGRAPSRAVGSPASVEERTRGGMNIPPALELLVRSLPAEGKPFPAARREQWLQMASATLAFVYPEDDEGEDEAEPEDIGSDVD